MLLLKAKMMNLYKSSDYTDKVTGVVTHGKNKLQLLVVKHISGENYKQELLDISIPEEKVADYIGKENQEVEVEVAYFGKISFYGI